MGHVPDWVRGSMGKGGNAPAAKPTTKFGVTSRPIFHSEAQPVQHFEDGGMAEARNDVEYADPLGAKISMMQEGRRGAEKPADEPKEKSEKSDYSDSGTFSKAFAAARSDGVKTFNWNGKSYTTELANSSKPKQPKANEAPRDVFSDDARSPDQVAEPYRPMHNEAEGNYDHLQTPKRGSSRASGDYSVTSDGRIRRGDSAPAPKADPAPKAEPAPKTAKPSLLDALREGMRTTRK